LKRQPLRIATDKPASAKACIVCGCTDKAACAVTCAWDRGLPDLCSGCASLAPYFAQYNGSAQVMTIVGPGQYPAAPTSLPLGTTLFETGQAKAIAFALNLAFRLGERLGKYEAKGGLP
jgi:hypothetical protein